MTQEIIPWNQKAGLPQVTLRSTVAGILIGSLVLVSNFQFGLQTGWVSMMSLPSALLGFAIFKTFSDSLDFQFTDVENVFVQSVAVSVGTGPLAYGFVGIIPAIEKFLTAKETGLGRVINLSLWDLILWSIGLGFFGIFFAVPLRKQVIVKEKLPFPSGSATATLISVLHNTELKESSQESKFRTAVPELEINSPLEQSLKVDSYRKNARTLVYTFLVSSVYTVTSYFVPQIRELAIFGPWLSRHYLWNFQPSPAYIGQGIIMGLPTVSYMMFGAILGWGVLAPLVQKWQWTTGPVDDWKTGAQGWILWIALSVMVSDSIVSFLSIIIKSTIYQLKLRRTDLQELQRLLERSDDEEVDDKYLVSRNVTIAGIVISTTVCVIAIDLIFHIVDMYAIIVAVMLAFFLSVLAVRALGETDMNPVSGIGKLSQLIIAFVVPKSHPASMLINLVAGGIAEAGAQQAGDLMQDLKTGHLIGASPKSQFIAQIIGTVWSVFLSAFVYKLYNIVYEIPNLLFRIPTAIIWIDCARLVTGQGLPEHAYEFSIFFAVVFGVIALLKNLVPPTHRHYSKLVWLPSGVPVGIGLYNIPSFTLARFLGGVIAYVWIKKGASRNKHVDMIIFSSGLVLGEGMLSIANLVMANLRIPHL